jgi:hypothetical protein
MSQWSRVTVSIDYHIAFDGDFYSVPYTLVQQVVEVRSTPTTWRSFTRATGSLPTFAVAGVGKPSLRTSIAPRAIKPIWNGLHRGW